MAIPQPHYDTVLLREHLYQDLKNRYLVIPPDAYKPGFRPLHEIGLGLFNYFLVNQEQLKTCKPPDQIPVRYNDFSYRDHGEYLNHSIYDTFIDLLLVSIMGFVLFIIIKMILFNKNKTKLHTSSSSFIQKQTHDADSLKPYSVSDYLEKGDFFQSPIMQESSSFKNFSQPPSLVNSPITPPSNLMSSSPNSTVSTAFNTPVGIVDFDHSFGLNKHHHHQQQQQHKKLDPSLINIANGLKIN